jgi:hypothetical protein
MRIDSLGNVKIGTPSTTFTNAKSLSNYLGIADNYAPGFMLKVPDLYSGEWSFYLDSAASVTDFVIADDSAERMRIDSSGRLLVGTSSEITGSAHYKLQSTGIAGAYIGLGRNDSTVAAGEGLGGVAFYGNDGGSYEQCASILAQADGTHAAGDKPTRLVFSTAADGASSPTERMRIDSSGNLNLVSGTSTLTNLNFTENLLNTYARIEGGKSGSGVGDLRFYTYSGGLSERARIDSSGRLLVGTSTAAQNGTAIFQGNNAGSTGAAIVHLTKGSATPADGEFLGTLSFADSSHVQAARVSAHRDGGTWTSGSSQPSRLAFSTTADGASSPTERLRIDSKGDVKLGGTLPASPNIELKADGSAKFVGNVDVTNGALGAIRATDAGAGSVLYGVAQTAAKVQKGTFTYNANGRLEIADAANTVVASIEPTGSAEFAGKVTSASTESGDAGETLATKDYVDANAGSGFGKVLAWGRVENDGGVIAGSGNWSGSSPATGTVRITFNSALGPNATVVANAVDSVGMYTVMYNGSDTVDFTFYQGGGQGVGDISWNFVVIGA